MYHTERSDVDASEKKFSTQVDEDIDVGVAAQPQSSDAAPRKQLCRDHPEVRNAKRGCFADAMRIVSDPELAERAAADLEQAFYAETSRASRDSLLASYCK